MLAKIGASRTLKSGILLFWALYFSLVALTNALDALKTLGILPAGFTLASGNYALLAKVTAVHGSSPALVALLFLGVIAWETLGAVLFWRSWLDPVRRMVWAAFTVSLALWATFTLSDEIFIAYTLSGTHLRLFGLSLLSLLALRMLPDD